MPQLTQLTSSIRSVRRVGFPHPELVDERISGRPAWRHTSRTAASISPSTTHTGDAMLELKIPWAPLWQLGFWAIVNDWHLRWKPHSEPWNPFVS